MKQMHWPRKLTVVRHGQSAGNVARDAAMQANVDRIDLSERDADVPLSELGRDQAVRSLGERLRRGFAALRAASP